MLFRRSQSSKPTSPGTPDSSRREIAMRLRSADKLIKEGKYAEAKEELDAVRELEPNNVYALALEERRQALENHTIKSAEGESQPAGAAIPEEKEQEPEKPQIDEAAIKVEIEKRLEIAYNKKFTDEIRKAEERIASALKKEREWQEAEQAFLISNLEKEKDKFRQELEKQSKEKLEIEVSKMEATFRQDLAAERKKAEEETRAEMSALYEKSMLELKEAAAREKRGLLEKERKAIEDSKRKMEAELEKRLSSELANIKASTIAEQQRESEKIIEAARQKLQKEYEERLRADEKRIEEEIKSQQSNLERSYEERHRGLESETQAELKKRLDEINENKQKEMERRQSEMRGQLESEYEAKLTAELAAQRDKIERRVEIEIAERQAKLEADRKKLVEEEQRKLDEARAAMRVEMGKELEQGIVDARKSITATYEEKLKLLGVRFPDTREEKLQMYMARLREVWATPPVTAEAARELMQLRDVLGLSFEDHLEREGEIRLQVYVTEVEKEIRKGGIEPNDESTLEELKHKYQITPEESLRLEPHMLAAFQRAVTKAVILVVDDEQEFLDTVRTVLEGYGYGVLTKQSPKDALKLLDTTNVDMIISDVMFPGTESDGFSFFERVQKVHHLKKVPFILMSGMQEGFFMRTGIQLGVDDYLTKPVDPDMLAAVVEGKLKKYRSLRENG